MSRYFIAVDYKTAPMGFLMSMVSLAGGACLGPEQALGSVGGGLALSLTEYIDFDEDDKKLIVLTGMTAAIGALFPSPLLTCLIMYELGTSPRSSMESVTILGLAATVALMINYELIEETWLEHVSLKTIIVRAIYHNV